MRLFERNCVASCEGYFKKKFLMQVLLYGFRGYAHFSLFIHRDQDELYMLFILIFNFLHRGDSILLMKRVETNQIMLTLHGKVFGHCLY